MSFRKFFLRVELASQPLPSHSRDRENYAEPSETVKGLREKVFDFLEAARKHGLEKELRPSIQ